MNPPPLPILIITANFYEDIAAELLKGATAYLTEQGLEFEVVQVPGAFEIPAAVAMAFDTHPHRFGGVVALGCVIRGETSHYDYVCGESARGLNDLAMRHALAVGNGILTVENVLQAKARASTDRSVDKGGNKGAAAAAACVAMMHLKERL